MDVAEREKSSKLGRILADCADRISRSQRLLYESRLFLERFRQAKPPILVVVHCVDGTTVSLPMRVK